MNPQRLNLCKNFSILAFFLFIFILYHNYESYICISPITNTLDTSSTSNSSSSSSNSSSMLTNVNHLLFSISGSANTWRDRRAYFQGWWRPNVTRGYIFFDRELTPDILPWPYDYFPPYRVSENTTKLKVYSRHMRPDVIRIVRTILETFREGDEDVRWFVMGDDDTVFFLDNLVEVIGRYDHTKYVYIGGVSECVKCRYDVSFEMAFGGAGFALSYPLVEALVANRNLDRCIETYSFYFFGDQIVSACIADLGVPLTSEKGFHQVDLRDDISGFLSAHPQAPLISLHHLDVASPIFPTMDRYKSVRHLMTPAEVDQSRLLQQTICYHKQTNRTISIAWGYSAYIYEQLIPRSILKRPIETFTPWHFTRQPFADYMFNTRPVTNSSCETPHTFFFHSITNLSDNHNSSRNNNSFVTNRTMMTYIRYNLRQLLPCSSNHYADHISSIRVYSPTTKLNFLENRGECCDVLDVESKNTIEVKIRACKKSEVVII